MTDHQGSCLCGGIAFATHGPLRNVIGCHCHQCRKWTGHFVAATRASLANFELLRGEDLVLQAAIDHLRTE